MAEEGRTLLSKEEQGINLALGLLQSSLFDTPCIWCDEPAAHHDQFLYCLFDPNCTFEPEDQSIRGTLTPEQLSFSFTVAVQLSRHYTEALAKYPKLKKLIENEPRTTNPRSC